jgi:hypothetical protein
MAADQVLVGRNETRRKFNKRIRELHGYHDPFRPRRKSSSACATTGRRGC